MFLSDFFFNELFNLTLLMFFNGIYNNNDGYYIVLFLYELNLLPPRMHVGHLSYI